MKSKIILILVISTLIIAACSAPAVVVDEVAVAADVSGSEQQDSAVEPAQQDSTPADDPVLVDRTTEEVSFSTDVWPILEKYAVAAHGGKGGVFLENYSDILSNVEPGNPEASLLYKALIGDGMKQMPPGNPLPDEMIQLIYDWIKQGAKEN